jgi:membrane-associated phospholipid phosphatase
MKRLRARPDAVDLAVADAVMRHTGKRIEAAAKLLTRLGDEKILLPLALAAWLAASPRVRKQRAHILKTLLAVSALDHGSKYLFAEQRPDRINKRYRHKGVPRSGTGLDAFPSGHAIHLGALACALSRFYPQAAPYIWGGAVAVAGTRVVLLAHWMSDVLLGLTVGAAIEQGMWAISGKPRDRLPGA